MSKAVILIVDDEPEVLNAVERDLRRYYKSQYRIVKAGSGKDALDATQKLKERGMDLALFLADERMPEMTGTSFLKQAKKLFPQAKKALLTAYADTEAAITAINHIGLDHYLLKPWDPPEERLYPILDDLLGDWGATVKPTYDGLRVVGAQWSTSCYDVREFLARNHVPYLWIDAEQDVAMRELAAQLGGGELKLPTMFFPDGSHLIQPDQRSLAGKVGLKTAASQPFYDMVVIGGGPAGLAAAVYGASEGLRTVLLEKNAPGGQAGTSSQIENYLGFPSGVSGADLARRAVTQAKRFGAELLSPQEVVGIRREDPYRIVQLADGTELSCYALIIATGVSVRMLDIPGASDFTGRGLYYGAAMTEAAAYRGKEVVVVGAANSAGQGAMFFSRYASKVHMLVRGDSLEKSMSQYLVDRINAAPNIEVHLNTQIAGLDGTERLERVRVLQDTTQTETVIDAGGVFVFIGSAPKTEIVAELVERDDKGYIVTGRDLIKDGKPPKGWLAERDPYLYETNVPGIFAAGDVRAGAGKRVAAAVGEGSATVGMVHSYLASV